MYVAASRGARAREGYDRQNGARDQTNNETHRARASPSRSRRPSGRRSASAAASSSRPRRARPPRRSGARRSTPSPASATPASPRRISRGTWPRPIKRRSAGSRVRRWSSTRSVCWMLRPLTNWTTSLDMSEATISLLAAFNYYVVGIFSNCRRSRLGEALRSRRSAGAAASRSSGR